MTNPTPSKDDVRNLLVRLLHEIAKIPVDKIHNASRVDAELQMQSVVFIEIQVALEDAYEVALDPVALVELNEFGAIVDYIYDTLLDTHSA